MVVELGWDEDVFLNEAPFIPEVTPHHPCCSQRCRSPFAT